MVAPTEIFEEKSIQRSTASVEFGIKVYIFKPKNIDHRNGIKA